MKGKSVGLLSDFQVYTVDYPSTSDLRDNTIFTLLTSHHSRPLTTLSQSCGTTNGGRCTIFPHAIALLTSQFTLGPWAHHAYTF